MYDEQFESFLREFEPRRLRALPETKAEKPVRYQRLAAAAVMAVTLAGSLWLVGTEIARRPVREAENVNQPPPSLLSLTRLAFDDPAGLDAALNEASRDSLPDFKGDDSTLRVLANE